MRSDDQRSESCRVSVSTHLVICTSCRGDVVGSDGFLLGTQCFLEGVQDVTECHSAGGSQEDFSVKV